jgi:hypothetical protein
LEYGFDGVPAHPVDLAVLSNASNMIVLVRVEAVRKVVVTYTGIGCWGFDTSQCVVRWLTGSPRRPSLFVLVR